ncbi:hypothetical protein [Streptomyces sp. NPDC058657]|uniref:hypothetical protein n=1 Tax=unclassified Streptomyces TaxID=2593676 RepID=UPI00365AF994
MVQVSEYERADGTVVRAHTRWAPGARRELGILVAVAAVVVFFAMGSTKTPAGTNTGTGTRTATPAPLSTGVYPVKLPVWKAPPQPSSTVTYPIPWER